MHPLSVLKLGLTLPFALMLPRSAHGAAADAAPQDLLCYLKNISGKRIVSGIHNREPNARPSLQTEQLTGVVGRQPGLWSGDFLFSADDINARWAMIYECKKQWDNGAIVQLMLHVSPPTQQQACSWDGGVLSRLPDADWDSLITDGTSLNRAWKQRLDDYAVYLCFLRDHGVRVLFRPFHEMNQGRFWWGGRKGPRGTAQLYRLTHDYLTLEKGLNNLVWVWDMQDMSRDFEDYNPGAAYWDIFAFDVYANGYDKSWYDYILPVAGEKPMIIGECSKLPSPEMLSEQPRWCLFMSWAELTFLHNRQEEILRLYGDTRVITREQLPRFTPAAIPAARP